MRMFELSLWIIITLIVCAFLCEYMDSTLGMGYGTTLTPVFMLMGFKPLQIVPAILLSELVIGVLAGIFHHREGNVNLKPKNMEAFKVKNIVEKPLIELWALVYESAGIIKQEFDDYFSNIDTGIGIFFDEVWLFEEPINIKDWAERGINFQPPQGFRYATVDELTIPRISGFFEEIK